MSNRIDKLFLSQKAFVGYLTVGDGGLEKTYESAKALIAGGVNLLELGVPFSDPIADGKVIQRASSRALHAETTLLDVLSVAKQLRQETDIPIILFTYFNPLFQYFNRLTAIPTEIARGGVTVVPQAEYDFTLIYESGIDGILVIDLPVEESMIYRKHCLLANLAPIYVITKASSDERIRTISSKGKGFLYYACRLGTTGIKEDIPSDLYLQMQRIKKLTHLPIVVGFGISTPRQSAKISKVADGFVVGSFFVDAISKGISSLDLMQLARKLNNF